MKLRLAVFLSGTGRTLENFFAEIDAGRLPAEVVAVVGSRADAFGLERARKRGVRAVVVPARDHPGAASLGRAAFAAIEPHRPDLVALAGWNHLIEIPPRYERRVLNIHPALLPAFGGKGFYGMRVHRAVIASGAQESGCTVHFADNVYDHGPAILRKRVPVLPGDTPEALAHRVFEAECEAYPEAIRMLAEGRVPGAAYNPAPP